MTTLDWNVYKFIKERSEKGIYTKQQDIADEFNINKRTARKCVQHIREEETIQKIVLSDYTKGYKLMSQEDEIEMLTKTKARILKELKRYWKDVKRYNLNNQIKLVFDTHERSVIESLLG